MMSDVTRRVMIDIETLGLEPGAALLSIGAVKFGADGLGDEFYRETLDWHLSDCGTFVGRTLTDGVELATALKDFYVWTENADEYWANSPKFDMTMLETAADAVDVAAPWEYYELRDVRTVKNLPGVDEPEFNGTEHHALDDAKHQARLVAAVIGDS